MTRSGTMDGKDPPKLRRSLNTPMLTLYGLGVTIGAGIYVLVGTTAAVAGQYAAVAFLVAAVVVAFTALSYAELSARFPVSAGEAAYVEAGFQSRWLATIVGLAVAASGIVSSAAISIGAASYLQGVFPVSPAVLTAMIVVLMGVIALWGIAQSVAVAATITVLEIFGLIFVITWGFGVAEPVGLRLPDLIPSLNLDQWQGIAAASLLAFFAFVGFEDMANVAEEVRDPGKTMPRAIFWTLLLATVLYILTTSAVLYSVDISAPDDTSAMLTRVFSGAPQPVQNAFSVIAIVATVNGVLIQMIMASRVLYGLADRGHLPAVLSRVSPRTRTPWVATLLIVALIVAFSLTLPIATLAEHTSQIVLVVFTVVNLSLIRLKFSQAQTFDGFRVPIIVPVLGVISSVGLLSTALL